MNSTTYFISNVGTAYVPDENFIENTGLQIIRYCVVAVLPIALISGVISILAVVVQTRGLFTMKIIRPKFSKLNPLTGVKRLFSMQSIVGILKGLLEVIIIGVIVYTQLESRMTDIGKLIDMEPAQEIFFTADTIFSIIMLICILLAFIAAADYVFQWWQYEKKLKMSKQEIKDEYKQIEGDPIIKGKIKQKQREIAQKRMMDQVPKADVVVRNPTHYAVALKYDVKNALSAPEVIAKGQDALALRIVKLAEENGVFVTENRPLARALYDAVDVGREIPASLFVAVAEVLSEMFKAKGSMPVINTKGARPKIKRSDLGK